jgi:hypothetical protein
VLGTNRTVALADYSLLQLIEGSGCIVVEWLKAVGPSRIALGEGCVMIEALPKQEGGHVRSGSRIPPSLMS